MLILAWLEPETRDPFKEIFKLPIRSSTVLGGDSQQIDNKEDTKTLQRIAGEKKKMPKIKT